MKLMTDVTINIASDWKKGLLIVTAQKLYKKNRKQDRGFYEKI